jgi:hypothetical protein
MAFQVTTQYLERLADRIAETEHRIREQEERIESKRVAGRAVDESMYLLDNLVRSRDALLHLHDIAKRILQGE